MAGALISMPTNGATNWEDFPDIVQEQGKEFSFLSLTNWSATTIPQVEAGSKIVCNYALYEFTADETIVDLAGTANDNVIWFKIIPAGTTCTVSAVTTDDSTWDADKGGYYDGNDRYIGGCYKDGSGNYVNKWVFRGRSRYLDVQSSDGNGYGAGYLSRPVSAKEINSYQVASTFRIGQTGVTTLYLKKPVSACVVTGGIGASTLSIYVNGGYKKIASYAINSTTPLMMNPGRYLFHAAIGNILYCQGVYGTDTMSSIYIVE